jgi:acetyl esterase/lipase
LLGHPLAKYLAEKNIACASISYTLYMQGKNRSFGCSGIASEKMRAIQIAASQLWHATAFLVENSKEYHIDTTKIFIAGSSAGAETVIHAACWNREKMQLFDQGLSLSFRYAGVIGGSGATTDINLITKENMVPMMLFHGDKDNLVPYGTAAHHYCKATDTGWLMMFGSHTIAERLNDLGGTCELITVKGGDHSCAGRLVRREQQTIVDFVNRVLREKNFILFRILEK